MLNIDVTRYIFTEWKKRLPILYCFTFNSNETWFIYSSFIKSTIKNILSFVYKKKNNNDFSEFVMFIFVRVNILYNTYLTTSSIRYLSVDSIVWLPPIFFHLIVLTASGRLTLPTYIARISWCLIQQNNNNTYYNAENQSKTDIYPRNPRNTVWPNLPVLHNVRWASDT